MILSQSDTYKSKYFKYKKKYLELKKQLGGAAVTISNIVLHFNGRTANLQMPNPNLQEMDWNPSTLIDNLNNIKQLFGLNESINLSVLPDMSEPYVLNDQLNVDLSRGYTYPTDLYITLV